jgi:hypothetical protein
MTIRSSLLSFAAIAAITCTSLVPANASVFGPRHFARTPYQFAFANRPGVGLCKRGIVYVCQ